MTPSSLTFIAAKLKIKTAWPLHLMLLPAVFLIIIFSYTPMIGIIIAFQDYLPTKGFFGSEWVGFYHFKYLFNLPNIGKVIGNTLSISILKIITLQFSAVILALIFNELKSNIYRRFAQSIILFPFFLSWVILGGIFIDLFSVNGGINNIITTIFKTDAVFFLSKNGWFRAILVATYNWKEIGYSTIIIYAAITSIDPALYESAVIDGANRWKQTIHITLPGILPIITLVATLALGGILNAGFDQIFVMYNPLVYETADIIDTFVYRLGIIGAQYSLATAVGLLKSFVGLFLIMASFKAAEKYANYQIF